MWLVCSLSSLMAQATGSPAACASLTRTPISVQSTWLASALRTTCSALSTTGRFISTSSPFILSTSCSTQNEISVTISWCPQHLLVRTSKNYYVKPLLLTCAWCRASNLCSWSFLTFSSFFRACFSCCKAFKSIFWLSILEKNSSTTCVRLLWWIRLYFSWKNNLIMIPQVCSCANMYLVKGIKLQIGAFCMLGKKEWMEFIVSASRHHTHELNNPLLHNQMKKGTPWCKSRVIREKLFTGFARS